LWVLGAQTGEKGGGVTGSTLVKEVCNRRKALVRVETGGARGGRASLMGKVIGTRT